LAAESITEVLLLTKLDGCLQLYKEVFLESAYTIVVPDTNVLASVCGTNDSNLKLIEDHLGVPVFTRGNELSIAGDDPVLRERFRFIIDRVLDEINDGSNHAEDVVASVLNVDSHDDLEHTSILVPGALRKVYPRTKNQAKYVAMLRSHDMVLCTGAAGSGKTFLAVAEALRLVLMHEKLRLVLTRPVVEAGESLGYLPGDLEQKINPYLRPLYDAMETVLPRDTVHKLIDTGVIETAPLAYMRGRTLNDSVIILDEAQNTTGEQMKMFLTRMGENSKVFITGDVTQIDLPRRFCSGLVHALKLLEPISEIGIMKLTAEDVVRNPLVRKIVKAYENEEKDDE
jgi:phosphate starvation-inducible protein PhoH and related proteins